MIDLDADGLERLARRMMAALAALGGRDALLDDVDELQRRGDGLLGAAGDDTASA